MFFRDDVAFDESTVGSGSYAEYETGSEESEDEGDSDDDSEDEEEEEEEEEEDDEEEELEDELLDKSTNKEKSTEAAETVEDEGQDLISETLLSAEEVTRIKKIFRHLTAENEEGLDLEHFGIGLALLGAVERAEKIKETFNKQKQDLINCDTFISLISSLRQKHSTTELNEQIKKNFDAIYHGTCRDDDQRDEGGRQFITASALRQLLTNQAEKLTDEEADELIDECYPKYESDVSGGGTKVGRIFFEQYRSMLLDSGTRDIEEDQPQPF